MTTRTKTKGEWIDRTPNNRWKARYWMPNGRTRSKTWDRKSDARRWLRSEKHKIDTHTWIDSRAGERLFSEVAASFLGTRVDVRRSTYARHKSYLNSMILPVFGSTPIGRIQPGTVQGWVSQLIKDGKAAATVRKAHQILSMCFDGAMRDRLISVNPCAETRLPRIEKGEIRLIGMEDIDRLADAMDTRYRAMVYCGALAGLRIGEVAALRIESFDPVGRTLMVDATLSETEHGRPKRTPVKTSASRRKVTMPQQLIDEIELHLVGHQGGEFIFESPDGGPLRLRNWRRRYWSPAVKASIGGRLRFHDLRHAHVALLIRLNVQPRVIQDRLGHASIRMTMDRYGHLFEGSDQAVAQRLDEMLAGDYAHSLHPVAAPMTASTR